MPIQIETNVLRCISKVDEDSFKIKTEVMKKILFLCDGDNFPQGAFRFIQQLRDTEAIYAKGLFFTSIDTEQLIPIGFIPISEPYVKLKEEEKIILKKSQERFQVPGA